MHRKTRLVCAASIAAILAIVLAWVLWPAKPDVDDALFNKAKSAATDAPPNAPEPEKIDFKPKPFGAP